VSIRCFEGANAANGGGDMDFSGARPIAFLRQGNELKGRYADNQPVRNFFRAPMLISCFFRFTETCAGARLKADAGPPAAQMITLNTYGGFVPGGCPNYNVNGAVCQGPRWKALGTLSRPPEFRVRAGHPPINALFGRGARFPHPGPAAVDRRFPRQMLGFSRKRQCAAAPPW